MPPRARKPAPSEYTMVDIDRLVALRRNPQFVSPHAMDALKTSMQRDGFLAPVLVRPMKGSSAGDYEIISGNHRVMAAREIGLGQVPCVVADLDDKAVGRIAMNLNTIHGDPTAELVAPFLAELDDETLAEIHLPSALLKEVKDFDNDLSARLAELQLPESWNNRSSPNSIPDCTCPTCGKHHVKAVAGSGRWPRAEGEGDGAVE